MMLKTEPETRLSIDELREQIDSICRGNGKFRDIRDLDPPRRIGPPEPLRPPCAHIPFGRWLLQQTAATGFVADLVAYAMADRSFPVEGDPEAVRARLREVMADSDMHVAVDDAELDWACY